MMTLPEGEAFNITFLQAVETYNCLYDTTSPDYSSKDELAGQGIEPRGTQVLLATTKAL